MSSQSFDSVKPQDSKYRNLKHLSFSDVPKAAETLFEAFKEDSLARLLVSHLDDPKDQDLLEMKLYESYLRQHILTGIVVGINEQENNFETVAIWSDPDSLDKGLESFTTLMKAGYGEVWDLAGEEGKQKIFEGMLPLLHDTCERITSTDTRFQDKPLYTLVYLGSTDQARGKGNVRLMFDYMFENFIDAHPNSIAYLESSSVSNIPIYNRFGFQFYEDIMLGVKDEDSVEGVDYAIMNVMIRGSNGHDWTKDANNNGYSSKL